MIRNAHNKAENNMTKTLQQRKTLLPDLLYGLYGVFYESCFSSLQHKGTHPLRYRQQASRTSHTVKGFRKTEAESASRAAGQFHTTTCWSDKLFICSSMEINGINGVVGTRHAGLYDKFNFSVTKHTLKYIVCFD